MSEEELNIFGETPLLYQLATVA